MAATAGRDVTLWAREEEVIQSIVSAREKILDHTAYENASASPIDGPEDFREAAPEKAVVAAA